MKIKCAECEKLWRIINTMAARADTCDCTHEDENCCAWIGEPCIVCLVATIDQLGSGNTATHGHSDATRRSEAQKS